MIILIYVLAPAGISVSLRTLKWSLSFRGAFKRRHRADDAARIGDCLYHRAGRRADRALFRRLESVSAAIRGGSDPGDRRAGAGCGGPAGAAVALAYAAAELGRCRRRQRSRQGARR